MRITASGFGAKGRRPDHEDHYCIGSHVEQSAMSCYTYQHTDAFFPKYGLIAAVADGIGGCPGGDYASRTALDLLQTEFYSESRAGATWNELVECMKRYLDKSQSELSSRLSEKPGYSKVGTSIAGIALMPPDLLAIFHAGDSRVLRTSNESVSCLTVDNTPFGTGFFGAAPLGAGDRPRAELGKEKAFAPGDRFLICSSSLHGVGRGLTTVELCDVLVNDDDVRFLAEKLALKGVKKDGNDNCTAVTVCISDGNTGLGTR